MYLYAHIYHTTQRSYSSTILKCINSLFIISVAPLIYICTLLTIGRNTAHFASHRIASTKSFLYVYPEQPAASFSIIYEQCYMKQYIKTPLDYKALYLIIRFIFSWKYCCVIQANITLRNFHTAPCGVRIMCKACL